MAQLHYAMPYTIDRFEDNDLVVLETDDGTSIDVPRAHVPSEAKEGDVLVELPKNELNGEGRYAVNYELTEQRKAEVEQLRASLPTLSDEGDIEL